MKRLESLDALRGFDMFFIMGGATLIAAFTACFPDSAILAALGEQMEHVEWEGLQHHDTIFPLFLFIAGVSFPFSLEKQLAKGKSTGDVTHKTIRRGITLVVLGMIYNGLLNMDFAHARFCSVLMHIGLGWMFAALIYTYFKNIKVLVGIVVAILVGYWLVIGFIPAPDANGADIFSKQGNIACWVDRTLLGAHSYKPEYDPEGFLSVIPSVATALMGVLSGAFIKRTDISGNRKAATLAIAGIILGIIGGVWGMFFPIIKALWTSSFACAVASYSLLMLALFYWLIDVKGWHRWDKFFTVIGMNSITIYLAQEFINFRYTAKCLLGGLANICGDDWGKVIQCAGYILVCWLFLYFLYKKNVFLKI